MPCIRDATGFVQTFAGIVGAGQAVSKVEAHSYFHEGAADDFRRRVLGRQDIPCGRNIDCGHAQNWYNRGRNG